MNFFAKNLRFLRKQSRTNQSALASQVNKGQTTIGNWENEVSEPGLDDLLIISNYFGIPVDDLLNKDLEKGKLTAKLGGKPDDQIGNLKGNLSGKLKAENMHENAPLIEDPEPMKSTLWLVLQELRRNSESIEQLRLSMEDRLPKI